MQAERKKKRRTNTKNGTIRNKTKKQNDKWQTLPALQRIELKHNS